MSIFCLCTLNDKHLVQLRVIDLGLESSTGSSQQYRPAYLEHFEKLELQNQRNLVGNRRVNENMLKASDPHVPGKLLGPIDFEFVSLLLNI